MKFLAVLFFAFCMPFSWAQTTGQIPNYGGPAGSASGMVSAGELDLINGDVFSKVRKKELVLEDIQGSPYTNNDFKLTQLYYGDESQGNIFYRYNAYNEEIEVKRSKEDDGIKALQKDKNISIRVAGNPMLFKTFIDRKNLTQNGYLVLIKDGAIKLYKRYNVKFTEGKAAQNSFVEAVPPRFTKFEEYYLEVPQNKRVDELVLSNKKFVQLLPEALKSKTKDYLKSNKIKIKDVNAVVAALRWLEENN